MGSVLDAKSRLERDLGEIQGIKGTEMTDKRLDKREREVDDQLTRECDIKDNYDCNNCLFKYGVNCPLCEKERVRKKEREDAQCGSKN